MRKDQKLKIDIETGTKTTGLFSKKTFYTVILKIQLSEEEKAIIKSRQLEEHVIMEMPQPASIEMARTWTITFENLLAGEYYYDTNTPAEAKVYQDKLIKSLKSAKEYLLNNETDAENISLEI